jgi:hypothetical protein
MEENRSESPDGLPVVDPRLLVAALPSSTAYPLDLWDA